MYFAEESAHVEAYLHFLLTTFRHLLCQLITNYISDIDQVDFHAFQFHRIHAIEQERDIPIKKAFIAS